MSIALGIDVGGSGIKGAPVDIRSGQLTNERFRIPTPDPSEPTTIFDVIEQVVASFDLKGPIGCTIPGVVRNGVVFHATNLSPAWEGFNAQQELSDRLNRSVHILNDADAAGIAEMRFGAGVEFNRRGVVLILTFGTGIGSAIFVNGSLVPNTELGSLELNGHIAETQAAGRLREERQLSWKKWIKRVQRFLTHVEDLFWPDLIIFGGGISSRSDRFLDKLQTRAQLVTAQFENNAGIVGAALATASNDKAN